LVVGRNRRPSASHWQTLSHNIVLSRHRHERGNFSGDKRVNWNIVESGVKHHNRYWKKNRFFFFDPLDLAMQVMIFTVNIRTLENMNSIWCMRCATPDLRQVSSFLWILRFSPPIKLTATILLKNCWKWR
jgi:hypothetical protein